MYYMSMEFLMGRSLLNALFNLDVAGAYGEALAEMGYNLETLVEQERDAVSAAYTIVFASYFERNLAVRCVVVNRGEPRCALCHSCICMLCTHTARAQALWCDDLSSRHGRCVAGAGQWRPWAPGRLLHGLDGDAQSAGLGLRHPVSVRHVPAGELATCISLYATSCWHAVWQFISGALDAAAEHRGRLPARTARLLA